MSRPRFELRTFCVLDRCDNQLRHRPIHGRFVASPMSNIAFVSSHLMHWHSPRRSNVSTSARAIPKTQ